jgi:hypothetical protein
MNGRTAVLVCLCLLLASAALSLTSFRPVQAADRKPVEPSVAVGRYQLRTDKEGKPEYLFDTATGKVWEARRDTTRTVNQWQLRYEAPPK